MSKTVQLLETDPTTAVCDGGGGQLAILGCFCK